MGLELRRLNIIAAALAAFIAVTIGDLTDVIGGGHAGIGGADVGITIEPKGTGRAGLVPFRRVKQCASPSTAHTG